MCISHIHTNPQPYTQSIGAFVFIGSIGEAVPPLVYNLKPIDHYLTWYSINILENLAGEMTPRLVEITVLNHPPARARGSADKILKRHFPSIHT